MMKGESSETMVFFRRRRRTHKDLLPKMSPGHVRNRKYLIVNFTVDFVGIKDIIIIVVLERPLLRFCSDPVVVVGGFVHGMEM